MRALIRAVFPVLLGCITALPALAQEEGVSKQQQLANEAFEALTQRMQKLRLTLKNTDPEKAQVIAMGSKFIQERALSLKMKEIKSLLDDELWDDAIDSCKSVVKDLNTLIDLLLKGDTRIEDILKEIERLEKIKDKVDKLIKDQKSEKEDSARAEALEQHLKNLEKAKKDLDAKTKAVDAAKPLVVAATEKLTAYQATVNAATKQTADLVAAMKPVEEKSLAAKAAFDAAVKNVAAAQQVVDAVNSQIAVAKGIAAPTAG